MSQQGPVAPATSGVGQMDVLASLLQQAQQLQTLQNQLAASSGTTAMDPDPQAVFNTVSTHRISC